MSDHLWLASRRRVVAAAGVPTADMLWNFDANEIPAQTDNTSLAAWVDSAPVPHNLQSPGTNGGNQPMYRTGASGAAINGNPVVQVAAGDQMDMPYPNFSPALVDQSCTFYWLGRYTAPQSGPGILVFCYDTPADHVIRLYADGVAGSNVGYEYEVTFAAPVDVNVASAVSGVQVLTWVFDKTSGTAKVYRDGVQIGLTSTNVGGTGAGAGYDFGNDFIEFFGFAGGTANLVGEHQWTLAYKVAHDDTTRGNIEAFLMARGGI